MVYFPYENNTTEKELELNKELSLINRIMLEEEKIKREVMIVGDFNIKLDSGQ
jgi:exonuclease III